MRRYDEVVEVRCQGGRPALFLWRGHLWKVRSVVVRWVETGEWWRSASVRAVLGSEEPVEPGGVGVATDLLQQQEVWRVEAARPGGPTGGAGTFDLVHEVAPGRWRLVGCTD